MKLKFNAIIVFLFSNVFLLLGGWDKLLKTLILLVIIDYLTGLAKAYKLKKLDSYIGFKGIAKKICLFFMVIVATQFDSMLIGEQPFLRTIAIMFYISNEGLSIIENMSELGVPIPEQLKKSLSNLKK